jgi:hypothetical protein
MTTMDWTNKFDKFVGQMNGAPMGLRDAMVIVGDTFDGAMRCVETHSGKKDAAAAVKLTRMILDLWPKIEKEQIAEMREERGLPLEPT